MSDRRTNTDDIEYTFENQVRLLDDLQSVLTDQLQLARRGNSTNEQFSALSGKAGSLMKEIQWVGILDLDELQYRREELRKQYEHLCLVVAAQKDKVCKELSQICKGRKTIGTYRSNIRS